MLIPFELSSSGNEVLITPIDELEANTEYQIYVSASTYSLSNRFLNTEFVSSFSTGANNEAVSPVITAVQRSDATTDGKYVSIEGGEIVTVYGTGFSSTPQVYVGGKIAEIISVSDSEIVFRIPRNSAGSGALEIINSFGRKVILHAAFTYLGDTLIEFLTPAIGSLAGGEVVELVGAGFSVDMTCLFNGNPAADVKLISPNRLSCVAPPGDFGFADISVASASRGRISVLEDGFLYSQFEENFFLPNHHALDGSFDSNDGTRAWIPRRFGSQ